MAETALDRLLRLAGPVMGSGRKQVNVRQYQRMQRGRLQAVRQHVQGHTVPVGRAVAPPPPPVPNHVLAGSLKVGDVIVVDRLKYAVTSVKPWVPKQPGPNTTGTTTGKNTGSKGRGVNTGGPPPTASPGPGMHNKSVDPQTQLDATAAALRLPWNSPEVEVGLRQLDTGAVFQDLLTAALPIQVVPK